ncbi:Lar family restriction alleviation protein [Pseudomonas sp. PDM23]|uniref:Lar family restriction alleviation protein n=1 Tax=unclassified Pseudomonas TaxID=196821 RepID=UPI00177AC1EC|nr:Lar family restriction alleviation protein [Pseudomonas sp. PDM23]MBD9671572.1 Lar family restriction alleviation protein [Pseudomonas sp. PDM21]
MQYELKSCPFCGRTDGANLFKEPESAHGGGVTYVYVRCSCSACGPKFDDWNNPNHVKDAVDAWNRRSA